MADNRVLVIGAGGLLGSRLAAEFGGLTAPRFDVTDLESCRLAIEALKPSVVINATAYTAVDRAEIEAQAAMAVNVGGARNLAQVCADIGARLVHYSTDYVFDGHTPYDYIETDDPVPLSVYGASKLAGERAVSSVMPEALVIRTAWLFGPGKPNFVTKVLQKAKRGRSFTVVNDQTGSPTYTGDLALATRILVEGGHSGLFHVVNKGETTWYSFAREAVYFHGLDKDLVKPISTAELNLPAPRPRRSVLAMDKFEAATGLRMRSYQAALSDYVDLLREQ